MSTRALVAGINDYGGRNSLPSCVKDATSFAEMLQKDLGLLPGDIKSLHDQQVTKDGLKAGLKWLFDGASSDDRLVFYYSGHGYQAVINGELREALVTQDGQFFDDIELADAMSSVPNGVLTIVLDTCFSGGLEKVFFNGGVYVGQSKAWTPSDSDAMTTKGFTPVGLSFRPFGVISQPDSKGYVPGAGAKVSDLTLAASKGLLVTAAQANETASASLPTTSGMSVFTFALLEQVNKQGIARSTLNLVNAAADKLTDMGMRQTPTVKLPLTPPLMGNLSFLSLSPLKATSSTEPLVLQPSEPVMNQVNPFAPALLSSLAEKAWYDTVFRIATAVVPAAIQAVQSKDFTPGAPALPPAGVDAKAWYDTVFRIATAVVPAAIQAAQSKDFTPGAPALPPAGVDTKAWYDTVFRIATAVVPAAIQAAQSKDFASGAPALPPAGVDTKAWYDTVFRIATAVVPAAIQAAQSKDFTPGLPALPPAGVDTKAWYDTVFRIATAVVPAAIQAVQSKGFTPGAPALPPTGVDAKAWYDTVFRIATAVVPAAIQAAQSKGFSPGVHALPADDAEAKAWYDTVLNIATAAIPVALAII